MSLNLESLIKGIECDIKRLHEIQFTLSQISTLNVIVHSDLTSQTEQAIRTLEAGLRTLKE